MKIRGILVSLAVLSACLVWSTPASAVPAFARQTNQACSSCHFQHFPALTSYGRQFKAGGYISTGKSKEEILTAENLSMPEDVFAALVTKLRYIKTNGTDKTEVTNTGAIQFPDEAAFFLGGRAGEHIGFITEITLADPTAADTNFTSFKIHYTDNVGGTNLSIIPFLTDAGGAPYGFELLNTGAQRFQRVAEERNAISAQQFIGPGSGSATGIALVAGNQNYFVNYSLWHPAFGEAAHKQFAGYLRAAITPTIGDWDTAVGVQIFNGTSWTVDTATTLDSKTMTKAEFIDAQAQGSVGGMPLGIYFTHGKAPGTTAGGGNTPNTFNDNPKDEKATSLLAELGFMPRFSAFLGYLDGDNGANANNTDKRKTIGLNWMIAQNSYLQIWNTKGSGSAYETGGPQAATGKNKVGLMLFSAF